MFVQLPFPYEEGADDDAEECLQDLIRQFDPCIGRRTVDVGTAEGIADDHDDSADEDSDHRRELRLFRESVVRDVGDRHGLQTVSDE